MGVIKTGLGYKIHSWRMERSERSGPVGTVQTTIDLHIDLALPEHADEFIERIKEAMERMGNK